MPVTGGEKWETYCFCFQNLHANFLSFTHVAISVEICFPRLTKEHAEVCVSGDTPLYLCERGVKLEGCSCLVNTNFILFQVKGC